MLVMNQQFYDSYNANLTFLRNFLAFQKLISHRKLRIVEVFVVTVDFIQ